MYLKEAYNEIHRGNFFHYASRNQNYVKQGEALSSLLFEFATRKARDDREGMTLNGMSRLLSCAHVNLLGEKMNVMKIYKDTLFGSGKEKA